ncbi:MAG: hypothetical protein HYT80_04355 [Euryarchaeota archaeon]|nr:hypothetical protein [Euryarchaeota archaeon]
MRIGILGFALLLALAALWLPWWEVRFDIFGQGVSETVAPYRAGDFADQPDRDVLSDEVLFTGILATLAAAAALATLVLELLPTIGRAATRGQVVGACVLTAALGLAAVLYTATAWPEEITQDTDFFDEFHYTGSDFTGNATFTGQSGWFLEIAGTVALPLVEAGLVFVPVDEPWVRGRRL